MTTTTLSRSAVRFRPIATQTITRQAAPLRKTHDPHTTSEPPAMASQTQRRFWMAPLVLSLVATLLLIWALQIAVVWGTTLVDDLRYGRPRTTHTDVFVGHENGDIASHFTAINIDGRIHVIEIPGGDASAIQSYSGPQLTGEGAELAPITLRFEDLDGDQALDMILAVGNTEIRYRNDLEAKTFHLFPPS